MKTVLQFQILGFTVTIRRVLTAQEKFEQDYMRINKAEILKKLNIAPSVDIHKQFVVQQ